MLKVLGREKFNYKFNCDTYWMVILSAYLVVSFSNGLQFANLSNSILGKLILLLFKFFSSLLICSLVRFHLTHCKGMVHLWMGRMQGPCSTPCLYDREFSAAPLCLFWVVWRERNRRAFNNKEISVHRIKLNIFFFFV